MTPFVDKLSASFPKRTSDTRHPWLEERENGL